MPFAIAKGVLCAVSALAHPDKAGPGQCHRVCVFTVSPFALIAVRPSCAVATGAQLMAAGIQLHGLWPVPLDTGGSVLGGAGCGVIHRGRWVRRSAGNDTGPAGACWAGEPVHCATESRPGSRGPRKRFEESPGSTGQGAR